MDVSPEKSSEPSAALSVDYNTSLSVCSNLYLLWLADKFLFGEASFEISMGRWSLPKSLPIWNWMSCFARFGDINAISNRSVLPIDLQGGHFNFVCTGVCGHTIGKLTYLQTKAGLSINKNIPIPRLCTIKHEPKLTKLQQVLFNFTKTAHSYVELLKWRSV